MSQVKSFLCPISPLTKLSKHKKNDQKPNIYTFLSYILNVCFTLFTDQQQYSLPTPLLVFWAARPDRYLSNLYQKKQTAVTVRSVLEATANYTYHVKCSSSAMPTLFKICRNQKPCAVAVQTKNMTQLGKKKALGGVLRHSYVK